jgi:hypothetical protein
MIVDDVRDALVDVSPPKQKENTRAEPQGVKEIAAVCPFYKDILGNQALRETPGGDAFLSGLVEAFYRLFMSLKAVDLDTAIHGLEMSDLWEADRSVKENEAMLEGEYPLLVGRDILADGHFGAGVYAAYALVEIALAKHDPAEMTPETHAEAPQEEEPDIASLLTQLSGTTKSAEEKRPVDPLPVAQPPRVNTQNEHTKAFPNVFSLAVHEASPGLWAVTGSIPMSFKGIAGLGRMISSVFGEDAMNNAQMLSLGNIVQVTFQVGGRDV